MVDGVTLIESLIGAVVTGIGRDALQQFYTITGNPLAEVIRSRYDSALAFESQIESLQKDRELSDVRALRRFMIDVAQDSTRLRGLRIEMMMMLGLAPCTNVRELLFGMGPDIERALSGARHEMLRFESDEAFFDLLGHTAERSANLVGLRPSFPQRVGLAVSGLSGSVLGNQRVKGCMGSLLTASTVF